LSGKLNHLGGNVHPDHTAGAFVLDSPAVKTFSAGQIQNRFAGNIAQEITVRIPFYILTKGQGLGFLILLGNFIVISIHCFCPLTSPPVPQVAMTTFILLDKPNIQKPIPFCL
jgi:hypothetical protein